MILRGALTACTGATGSTTPAKRPPGTPEDDDDGVSPSVNRVMSLVETVYLTVWARPVDYALRYDRSGL
jgi:hypothetical protein